MEYRNLPPGLSLYLLYRCHRRHVADVVQEAWLAFLTGRNPNTAARNYMHRETLHELREIAESQFARADDEADDPPHRTPLGPVAISP